MFQVNNEKQPLSHQHTLFIHLKQTTYEVFRQIAHSISSKCQIISMTFNLKLPYLSPTAFRPQFDNILYYVHSTKYAKRTFCYRPHSLHSNHNLLRGHEHRILLCRRSCWLESVMRLVKAKKNDERNSISKKYKYQFALTLTSCQTHHCPFHSLAKYSYPSSAQAISHSCALCPFPGICTGSALDLFLFA